MSEKKLHVINYRDGGYDEVDQTHPGLSLWNRFEKRDKGKTWIFEINCSGKRVQHRFALQGAKPKLVVKDYESEDTAQTAFKDMIIEKQNEGFSLLQVKM